jgi:hypothetical protein
VQLRVYGIANITDKVWRAAISPLPVNVIEKFIHHVIVGNEQEDRLRALLELLQYGVGAYAPSSVLNTLSSYIARGGSLRTFERICPVSHSHPECSGYNRNQGTQVVALQGPCRCAESQD